MAQALMRMPDITCYGGSSNDYDARALSVDFGPVTVWFSYTTVVAFQVAGGRRVVQQNYWSRTTGRHLNMIDNGDKKSRVSDTEFEAEWDRQVAPFFDEDGAMDAARPNMPAPEPKTNWKLPMVKRRLFPLPKLKLK